MFKLLGLGVIKAGRAAGRGIGKLFGLGAGRQNNTRSRRKRKIRIIVLLVIIGIIVIVLSMSWVQRIQMIRQITNLSGSVVALFSTEDTEADEEEERLQWVWRERDEDGFQWNRPPTGNQPGLNCPPQSGGGGTITVTGGNHYAEILDFLDRLHVHLGITGNPYGVFGSAAIESSWRPGSGNAFFSDHLGNDLPSGSIYTHFLRPHPQNRTRNSPRDVAVYLFSGSLANRPVVPPPSRFGSGNAITRWQVEPLAIQGWVARAPESLLPEGVSSISFPGDRGTWGHPMYFPDLMYGIYRRQSNPDGAVAATRNVILALPEARGMSEGAQQFLTILLNRVAYNLPANLNTVRNHTGIMRFYIDLANGFYQNGAAFAGITVNNNAMGRDIARPSGDSVRHTSFWNQQVDSIRSTILPVLSQTTGMTVAELEIRYQLSTAVDAGFHASFTVDSISRVWIRPVRVLVDGRANFARAYAAAQLAPGEEGNVIGPPPVNIPIPPGCPGHPGGGDGGVSAGSLDGWVWPATTVAFSRGVQGAHNGIDIGGRAIPWGIYRVAGRYHGTPVFSARDGVVLAVRNNYLQGASARAGDGGGHGNLVIIYHGAGYMTLYSHLYTQSVLVSRGEFVRAGQQIARIGNSGSTRSSATSHGRSSGHLHFEVWQWFTGDNARSEMVTIENYTAIHNQSALNAFRSNMANSGHNGLTRNQARRNPFGVTSSTSGYAHNVTPSN